MQSLVARTLRARQLTMVADAGGAYTLDTVLAMQAICTSSVAPDARHQVTRARRPGRPQHSWTHCFCGTATAAERTPSHSRLSHVGRTTPWLAAPLPLRRALCSVPASPPSSSTGTTSGSDDDYDERGASVDVPPLTVVFDMDETLVHSTFDDPELEAMRQPEQRKKNASELSADRTFRIMLDGMRVRVNVRPGVETLLAMCHQAGFETWLFTTALPEYANHVIDHLDPEGVVFGDRKLFRASSRYLDGSARGPARMAGGSASVRPGAAAPYGPVYVKDLRAIVLAKRRLQDGHGLDGLLCSEADAVVSDAELEQAMRRTVLVDNSRMALLAQPANGILVPDFYDDGDDRVLWPDLGYALLAMKDSADVRSVLRKWMQLEQQLAPLAEAYGLRRAAV